MIDFTTVVGINDHCVQEFEKTWPTWKLNRPELSDHPLLLICDGERGETYWQQKLRFVQHTKRKLICWDQIGLPKKEKMASALTLGAVSQINTPWLLKLDTNAVAVTQGEWLQPEWFHPNEQNESPVFVASPWGRTKPAEWLNRLENWAETIPDLSTFPRLNFSIPNGASAFRHPRMASWCFFGNTAWCRRVASWCADDRLPVPSHDTFHWYCAKRRGDFFRCVPMVEFGWRHIVRFRKLRQTCNGQSHDSDKSVAVPTSTSTVISSVTTSQLDVVSDAGRTDSSVAQPTTSSLKVPFLRPRHARDLVPELLRFSSTSFRGAEVGVAEGALSNRLLHCFPTLFLTMVDSWATYSTEHAYRRSGDGHACLNEQQQAALKALAISNTDFASHRRHILQSDSCEAAESIADGSLDFVFIDADHTYEAVRKDIHAWWPKVRPNGLMSGHDYDARKDKDGRWGVARAVQDFARDHKLAVNVFRRTTVWAITKPDRQSSNPPVINREEGKSAPPEKLNVNSHGGVMRGESTPCDRLGCGVILYNRGTKCLIRMLVCLHSLRKWWSGPITVVLEGDHPEEICIAIRRFGAEILQTCATDRHVFLRKVEVCIASTFERTLWLDSDTIVCGSIGEIFDALDEHEVVTPHFASWWSDGPRIRKRIRRYTGLCPDDWIAEAERHHPAVNMGVLAFRRGSAFLAPWLELSKKGVDNKVFLPEEIAFQILFPRFNVGIIEPKFGVSVKFGNDVEDVRVVHYHGRKHVHSFPLCSHWLANFQEFQAKYGDIGGLLYWADRQLRRFLRLFNDVTLVTACDRMYVEKLRLTFPTWVRHKRADAYPIIVFVHGIPIEDRSLDFLRAPNVRLIPWDLEVANQRERMLSAFVFGTAEHVQTRWWMKLDADTFAMDDRPFVTEEMKKFSIFGHSWGLSRAEHIVALDAWAASHAKLKTKPMFEVERLKGDKYRHPRTQSFAQLQSSRFTRLCARLAGNRMPVPSHDTYVFYVADRLGYPVGRANFKKCFGFGHCGRLRSLKKLCHG
ncbi:MAG: class I SAM-dependent methyltransferase [Planctomycetes bacterium]|nr:class I SAM-dependent methyltransferase [Planctomycetota bacterium]